MYLHAHCVKILRGNRYFSYIGAILLDNALQQETIHSTTIGVCGMGIYKAVLNHMALYTRFSAMRDLFEVVRMFCDITQYPN